MRKNVPLPFAATTDRGVMASVYVDGGDVVQRYRFLYPSIGVSAHANGDTQRRTLNGDRGICQQGGLEILDRFAFAGRGRRVAEEALELLAAPNCPSGAMHVAVMPDERNFAGTSFVTPEMFGHYRYGSELLNVTFDPTRPEELGSYAFWVEVKDMVGEIGDQTIFTDPRYVNLILRRPPAAPFPNLPGQIDAIVDIFQNLGKIETSGIDIDVALRFPAQPWRQVTARLNGTYTIKFDFTDVLGVTHKVVGDRAPVVEDIGVIARWRHYLNLDFNRGPWGVTVAQNLQQHYLEEDLSPTATSELRRAGSYSVWDLSAQYAGFKNTTLTLGVRNLFDRDPPFTSQGAVFQVGYDPSYADPRGRFYYGSVKYAFK